MQCIHSCIFTSALVFCFCAATAQDLEAYVREMFPLQSEVRWIRSMSGTLNDVHPASMAIGYDGRYYRGLIDIDGLPELHEVVGEDRDGQVALQEIDNRGLITGYYFGDLREDRFDGAWWSHDMARSIDINLRRDGLVYIDKFEPRLLRLESDGQADFFVSLESPYVATAAWHTRQGFVRLLGNCEDPLCNNVSMESVDGANTHIRVDLKLNKYNSELNTVVGGTPVNYNMVTGDTWRVVRVHHLGNDYMTDAAYPRFEIAVLDTYLEDFFADWMRKTLASRIQNVGDISAGRWQHTASAWIDVFLLDEDFVGGLITAFNIENGNYDRQSFLFSVQEDTFVELTSLTKRKSKPIDFLRSMIDPLASYSAEDYTHIVPTTRGVCLVTDFDPVEGDDLQYIPYAETGDLFRRRAFIAKLED